MFDPEILGVDWLSPVWFSWRTLRELRYEFPVFLYLIPGIPLLYALRWLFFFRFRKKVEVAFLQKKAPFSFSSLLRLVPPILFAMALALVLLALARPQRVNEVVEKRSDGIDIILCLDVSESMEAQDFAPNRLGAAKQVAARFIEGRQYDRIGLVLFAGEALSLAPLTSDYALLQSYLQEADFEMIPQGGTALGTAIGVATNRLRNSAAASKIIILLSDGANTAGSIDPATAARLARSLNIRIYTIGVGQDGKVSFGTDEDGRPVYVEDVMDESTLKELAQLGDGAYFRARDVNALAQIFRRIDRLERSEVVTERFEQTSDLYFVYLVWAMWFWLAWLLSKNTFMANALED